MVLNRKDGRVAEGARLESVYGGQPHQGFESLSFRQLFLCEILGKGFEPLKTNSVR